MSKKLYFLSSLLLASSCMAIDPFSAKEMIEGEFADTLQCKSVNKSASLGLVELSVMAICNNPDAKIAYENALYQAYQVGASKASYLPSLSASGALSSNKEYKPTNQSYDQKSASLTASLLLYDFGGRSSSLQSAKALFEAVNAGSNQTMQGLFYSVLQGYYGLFSAETTAAAALDAQKAAHESLKAATARYEAGSATKSDKLQAQTAYSNATLALIKAEGDANIARANMFSLVGLEPTAKLALKKPSIMQNTSLDKDVASLIEEAKLQNPQVKSAKSSVESARATIGIIEAIGLPSISLSSTLGYSDTSLSAQARSSSVGVYASIPIFSGFSTAYKIKSAKVQLAQKENELQKVLQQVSLDVVTANQNFLTQKQTLAATSDLVESAKSSYELSLGRYKAGVASILELLGAQSTLASANEQKIKSEYNFALAKAALAKSIGRLGLGDIKSEFGQTK